MNEEIQNHQDMKPLRNFWKIWKKEFPNNSEEGGVVWTNPKPYTPIDISTYKDK